ncbi:helix-turn-helix domain-containing protein [Kocuria sediminis]|uniref:Helix-turn-helix domain-containing protein n=1 Tax=Kocuria sediminis TaxID=1038857 RepID=A0A6N8GQ65_9MICC|nr:transcriptional regulator [Kocuria sediminis]MUN63423.1 helix-turn-helix domain-containing protein [Kocuria sediminis]
MEKYGIPLDATAGQDVAPVLDETIHSPHRLRICALLHQLGTTEYQLLRESLQVSASVLSKHLKKLEEAGYVDLSTRTIGTRPHGWATLTACGARAYRSHLAYLEELIQIADSQGKP